MITIVEKKDRGKLGEGRNNGMGFGFLQHIKDRTFHTVQPLSPCKDYLAEVVFTEKHDIPTKGCGLSYPKKLDIFTDIAYMGIKLMPIHGSKYYSYGKTLETDVKLLAENYKSIQRLMNQFELELGLKSLTRIEPANDDYFLVTLSSEWCDSTHSISLYTLLLRVLMVATEDDKDIVDFLKGYEYHLGDKQLLAQVNKKIELVLKEKKLPPNTYPYSKSQMLAMRGSPHNNGIVNWSASFKEVPLGK